MSTRSVAWRRRQRRALFVLVSGLIRRCSFAQARRLGEWLGALHYRVDRRRRHACLVGMAHLQQRSTDDPALVAQLREAYRVNSRAVLEVVAMVDRRLDDALLRSQCEVEGLPNLEAARSGRGAILLANHSGNSLLLTAQLASAGWPITVVYRHARMMSTEFFAAGLPRYGIEGILANEGFKAYARMVDALRRDRILFAMMDQGVKEAETGLPSRFLGKDMPMPAGLVQLARQSRAPILPVATLAADPVWRFAIEPPLARPAGGTLDADLATVLAHMERLVLARPQFWSWHQRRWRKFPLAAS